VDRVIKLKTARTSRPDSPAVASLPSGRGAPVHLGSTASRCVDVQPNMVSCGQDGHRLPISMSIMTSAILPRSSPCGFFTRCPHRRRHAAPVSRPAPDDRLARVNRRRPRAAAGSGIPRAPRGALPGGTARVPAPATRGTGQANTRCRTSLTCSPCGLWPRGARRPRCPQVPPPGTTTRATRCRATGYRSLLCTPRTAACAAAVCHDNQPGRDCTAPESAGPGC
jgi:hypothetical protein